MKSYMYISLLTLLFVSCSNETDTQQEINTESVDPVATVDKNINYTTVNGVGLPDKLGFAGYVRNYVGGGCREAFYVRAYSLGLYMAEKSTNPDSIVNGNTAMSVRLHMTTSVLTNSLMEKFIRKGFDLSTGNKSEPYIEMIDMICGVFSYEPTEVGDVYDIHFTPDVGVSCSKNGKVYDLATLDKNYEKTIKKDARLSTLLLNLKYTKDGHSAITNFEFKKALFGMWFSENNLDEDLKRAVLGIED